MCAYLLLVVGASEREKKGETERSRESKREQERDRERERKQEREREREREKANKRERKKSENRERGRGREGRLQCTLPRFPRCVVRRCSSSRRRLETSSRSAIRASERVTSMPRPRRLRLSSASFAVAVSFLPFLSPATSLAAETSAA